jgi:hypothetical protein
MPAPPSAAMTPDPESVPTVKLMPPPAPPPIFALIAVPPDAEILPSTCSVPGTLSIMAPPEKPAAFNI